MARILVVDDNAASRKLVVALLSYDGHVTLEARDGVDGLAIAREERPQLIISDIVMPSMDGYAFARQLRADRELGETPVIFYTAHYHEREAHKLAEDCRVARVLVKPCPAAEMLRAVEQVLAGITESDAQLLSSDCDREHLLRITHKLSEKADALAASNARLADLTELNVELASERDPHALLEKVCADSRKLLGSRYAVLAVTEKAGDHSLFFVTSGIDSGGNPLTPPDIDAGPLGEVIATRRPWRMSGVEGRCIYAGLPESYPPASAFLVVPLISPTHAFGWLCLADKIGADGFDVDDERLLAILGAQIGRIYENGSLFVDAQRHVARLQAEMRGRERAYAVLSGINSMIVQVHGRDELCNEACRLAVESGHCRLACVGVLDAGTGQIIPFASAGDKPDFAGFTHGASGAGPEQAGMLATAIRSRQPVICNDLQTLDRTEPLRDEMLERGYGSVAVLPLVIENAAVGCLTLVAAERGSFDDAEVRLLTDLAGGISFALDRIEQGRVAH